jgi:hypothetical protein
MKRWLSGVVLVVALCGGCTKSAQEQKAAAVARERAAVAAVKASQTASARSPGGASSDKSVSDESPVQFIAPPLTVAEIEAGWISLFDGVSLFGWSIPEVSNWHVEDGAIVADRGDRSLLLTPFRFSDFELRCKFHLAAGGNSGLFLRTAAGAADPARDTYELNICDSHATHRTGSLVGRHVAENVPAVEGAWHEFRVLCEGPRLQVWLDGTQIVDFTDSSDAVRLSGQLGLQFNQGRAMYKDVLIRPLGARPLFNGSDLTGWRVVPGSKSEFTVVDRQIHVTGGAGFLETEQSFGDFALTVQARLNGDGLNSGVFFRAQPGTEQAPSHGYEMQLHNGVREGDRTKPVDSGTGAIFRRVAARYVVADDREFLTAVLLCQGDRIATWVNGYQVVNWQDTREASENPREGRRLEPGHISLQGHDPTTDLDFRSITLAPL